MELAVSWEPAHRLRDGRILVLTLLGERIDPAYRHFQVEVVLVTMGRRPDIHSPNAWAFGLAYG